MSAAILLEGSGFRDKGGGFGVSGYQVVKDLQGWSVEGGKDAGDARVLGLGFGVYGSGCRV